MMIMKTDMMKKTFQVTGNVARILTLLLCYFVTLEGFAQSVEGTSYYLPKTAVKVTLMVEKTEYTPGEFAAYAQRYMKKADVEQEASTTFRLVSARLTTFAVPDTAKHFTLLMDKRYSISDVARADNGILLAVNAEPNVVSEPAPFVSARKIAPLNPKDYMNEDILTAGSTAKMAQLVAQEIYDIRDSRNQLQRGQAEFMPQDGQQLRIMMDGLDIQERALRQVFEGVTVKDTSEVVLEYVPMAKADRELFFRFSRHFGVVDTDDLSGVPYYISVETDTPAGTDDGKKKEKNKDDIGLNVNLPVKARLTLFRESQPVEKLDFYAPQFGTMENLSGALFGKKLTSKIVLNPITGGIESIKEESLEK